ncbi:hypothetical protein [Dyella flagellata]|uniref:DNA polymerase III subunit psi n=1 Tax=Dyella flagellata TaxID=1867833 RepID=A0ABQ5XIG4_9GAMM|nr:hypothetical protein [Dyella flagellata]GLQ90411.1 hypothetical protein GCM10007898_39870 [Dyella flagellata]
MNAVIASPAHRARVLRALGVVAWQRRAVSEAEPAQPAAKPIETQPAPANAGVVVVLPPGCAVRELDLLGRALSAFGAQLTRAPRIEALDGEAMQVPHAPAYLVFGQAQAHALGRGLPAQVMRDAHIVLADAPAEILTQASAKRRLWQAMRALRRALAAGGR